MILIIDNVHQVPYVKEFSVFIGEQNTEIAVIFNEGHPYNYEQFLEILGILGAGNWYFRGVSSYNCPTYNDVNTPNSNWEGKLLKKICEASKYGMETSILGVMDNNTKFRVIEEGEE